MPNEVPGNVPPGQPFGLSDTRQIRIHERLNRLVGAGPAAFFYDACRLMEQRPPFKATTHLVSHMLREIESALRDVLEPVSRWPDQKKKMPSDSKEDHKREVLCILDALGVSEQDPIRQMWLDLAGKSNEGALHRRAHRSSLSRPRPLDGNFEQMWQNTQAVLDYALIQLERRFSEYQALMDQLAVIDSPSKEHIKKFRENLPNSLIASGYFFNKLKSPAWVKPLRESGVFKEIPEPTRENNTISCPFWPAAEYLKRVAETAPTEVAAVLVEIPETENWRAIEELTDIAGVLPNENAVQWSKRIVEWIISQRFLYFGLPPKLGEFINNLVKKGETVAALELTGALLEVLEDPRAEDKDENSLLSTLRQPTARFDLWEYEQILQNNILVLVDAAEDKVLALLCDLLDRAIVLSDKDGGNRRPHDLSYISRSAIEDHAQNLGQGIVHLLISAVRNASEQMVRKRQDSVSTVVQALEARSESWTIFQRIALHLLRVFPEVNPELVRDRLLDRKLFNSVATWHEYFLLEREQFGRLEEEDQKTILQWIEEGPPDIDERLKAWQEFTGRPLNSDDKANAIREWQRNRLAAIENYLESAWKEVHPELISAEDKPAHPEFTSYRQGGAFAPLSPQTGEQLALMSPKDLVSYLIDWKPIGDYFHNASPEGLGRQLTSAISANPGQYAENALEFARLMEPTYVRAAIEGFQTALKAKREFNWTPVLELCAWAVSRERDISGRKVDFFEMDPHWGWTRASIARFLQAGFNSENKQIPFDSREQAWQAIEPMTHDPDPTSNQEDEQDEINVQEDVGLGVKTKSVDPYTSAINSVRGQAIETVIAYALWVRRGFENTTSKEKLQAQGLEIMPEVSKVLEEHLQTSLDPSIVIRSLYGKWFPWLKLLDRNWTERNVAKIFQKNEPELWHAAWDAYIGYCQPYDDILDLLQDEYAFAIEQINSHEHDWGAPEAPDHSLAQHLMTFYWRGKLELDGNLLKAFYHHADRNVTGQALTYIGRSLHNTKEAVPADIAERFKKLLDRRLAATAAQPQDRAEELKEYGWWFISGKFDDEWSINHLLEVLKLTGLAVPDHFVVERLAKLADAMPLQCIEALTMMVAENKNGWGILGWRQQAQEIIRAARRSGNMEARKKADDLINVLGSRGYFDFGELLNE